MIYAFFGGFLTAYIASGAVVLAIVRHHNKRQIRAADTLYAMVSVLAWPLFVDHLLKRR